MRPGDTLVVWKLDRLARSIKDLIQIVEDLERREVAFRSLSEGIDTSTAQGRLMMHLFGAFAEFERSLIRERTLAGLEAARARGKKGGRKIEAPLRQMQAMAKLLESNEITVAEACRELGIARATRGVHGGDHVRCHSGWLTSIVVMCSDDYVRRQYVF